MRVFIKYLKSRTRSIIFMTIVTTALISGTLLYLGGKDYPFAIICLIVFCSLLVSFSIVILIKTIKFVSIPFEKIHGQGQGLFMSQLHLMDKKKASDHA